MGSSSFHMALALLMASVAVVLSRPQETISSNVDVGAPQTLGGSIWEIVVSTQNVVVNAKQKVKTTTKAPEEVESDGPGFLRFIGGPESELIFGPEPDTGVAVAVASGPSSPTLTFNSEAQIVEIPSK